MGGLHPDLDPRTSIAARGRMPPVSVFPSGQSVIRYLRMGGFRPIWYKKRRRPADRRCFFSKGKLLHIGSFFSRDVKLFIDFFYFGILRPSSVGINHLESLQPDPKETKRRL